MHNLKLIGQSIYLAEPYISQSLSTKLVFPWIWVKLSISFCFSNYANFLVFTCLFLDLKLEKKWYRQQK